jgi:colicin import membrane protein
MKREERIRQCIDHFGANAAISELHVTEDGQVFESLNYALAHAKSAKHSTKPQVVGRGDIDALEAKAAKPQTAAKAKEEAAAKAKEEAAAKAKEEAAAKAKEEAEAAAKAKEEAEAAAKAKEEAEAAAKAKESKEPANAK